MTVIGSWHKFAPEGTTRPGMPGHDDSGTVPTVPYRECGPDGPRGGPSPGRLSRRDSRRPGSGWPSHRGTSEVGTQYGAEGAAGPFNLAILIITQIREGDKFHCGSGPHREHRSHSEQLGNLLDRENLVESRAMLHHTDGPQELNA
eukprot:766816-Hanusia_phi.AAC.8